MSADSLGRGDRAAERDAVRAHGRAVLARPGRAGDVVDAVEAGNLYVNRGTTGAIVRRQPFGGWKRSSVGAGTKAGGPNYLVGLTNWDPAPAGHGSAAPSRAAHVSLLARRAARARQPRHGRARRCARDAVAWASEFGTARDVSGLEAERNVLRYLPVPVTIRHRERRHRCPAARRWPRASPPAPGSRSPRPARSPRPSSPWSPAPGQRTRRRTPPPGRPCSRSVGAPARVRLIGGDRTGFAAASGGRPGIALYPQPVVEAGRIEMLPFLHEQAIAVTAHRFGSPTPLAEALPWGSSQDN